MSHSWQEQIFLRDCPLVNDCQALDAHLELIGPQDIHDVLQPKGPAQAIAGAAVMSWSQYVEPRMQNSGPC